MRRLLFTTILTAVVLIPVAASGQPTEMLLEQGCDVFDLVEDLGEGPDGASRWTVQSLRNEKEFVFVFDSVSLIPRPPAGPGDFSAVGYVAWRIEGTGIQGTNRTVLEGTILNEAADLTGYFEGETFRGTVYKSGGLSGNVSGNLVHGFEWDSARIVLCKAGFGG